MLVSFFVHEKYSFFYTPQYLWTYVHIFKTRLACARCLITVIFITYDSSLTVSLVNLNNGYFLLTKNGL